VWDPFDFLACFAGLLRVICDQDLFSVYQRKELNREVREENSILSCKRMEHLRMTFRRWNLLAALAFLLLLASGCDVERRKSDAELGLNPQQSAGRKIYDSQCDRCHEPYSKKGKKGPGLKGVFQDKYLSLSGLPANDDRVSDIIRLGRKEMPAYGQTLSPQDIQDLMAYLHTL
jgi:mono/diheme cytochrome c family protein